jgi:hypothetical protein
MENWSQHKKKKICGNKSSEIEMYKRKTSSFFFSKSFYSYFFFFCKDEIVFSMEKYRSSFFFICSKRTSIFILLCHIIQIIWTKFIGRLKKEWETLKLCVKLNYWTGWDNKMYRFYFWGNWIVLAELWKNLHFIVNSCKVFPIYRLLLLDKREKQFKSVNYTWDYNIVLQQLICYLVYINH